MLLTIVRNFCNGNYIISVTFLIKKRIINKPIKTNTMNATTREVRPLSQIAREIRKDWTKVNYCAVPYLNAMCTLHSINDYFGYDSAKSIVLYF